jgi:hypothetical protein
MHNPYHNTVLCVVCHEARIIVPSFILYRTVKEQYPNIALQYTVLYTVVLQPLIEIKICKIFPYYTLKHTSLVPVPCIYCNFILNLFTLQKIKIYANFEF